MSFTISKRYINNFELMFLNRYKNLKKLGKGAYGDVYLVEDQKNIQFALKLMSVKMIENEPHLREYLNGEIQCMQTMSSPQIIKLYQKFEDETNIYLLLEYCNGGDLINYQAKLENKVFPLDKATEVLSEVIIGLEQLHEAGFLHRDIKSQNVLIQYDAQGKQNFKLADFGFSKKISDLGGTVLGTEHFMSPEIYSNELYGFEVDMWAFGVLFFFMLNMEFPFKINPHLPIQKKQIDLAKMATNFSYKKAVEKTKKKVLANCTPQVEDLFAKMFEVDSDKRVTFSEIREHPLFQKYFHQIAPKSKILYANKFKSKIVTKAQSKPSTLQLPHMNDEENIRVSYSKIIKPDKKYPDEKKVLDIKKDELDFLKDNASQFLQVGQTLKEHEKLMLSFNVLKYYIVLMRNFKNSLKEKELLQRYPNLKWKEFVKTNEFKDFTKEIEEDLSHSQIKFEQLYDQCEYVLKEIESINSQFGSAFQKQIKDDSFEGAFKKSYRKSTIYIFGILRQALKANKKGNKLNYMLSLLVISHAFNNIFSDKENVQTIFELYFQQKQKSVEAIDYSELREWMSKSSREILNNIAKNIIKIYFQS